MTGNKTSTVGFVTGDRVASTVMGYYLGMPGKVVRPAQVQYDMNTRYLIELDIGKTITLMKTQIAYYIDK